MARGRDLRDEWRDLAPAPEAHDRIRIAQGAARLIVEHGIADWSLAKRKAARALMLPERTALPGDDEVEAALTEHHAIFGGAEHEAALRAQREEALRWMRRLAAFRPRLVGGVAEGWATRHSDIRLELVADDTKMVELELINAGLDYRPLPERAPGVGELHLDTAVAPVRLVIRSEAASRQLPRRDRRGQAEVRLDADALARVLAG